MEIQDQGKKMGEIIAKAWADDAFKQRLLYDTSAVFREEGIEIPLGVEVRVVENTDLVFHLVLPRKPVGANELTDEELDSVAAGANSWVQYYENKSWSKCYHGDATFRPFS